MVLAVGDQCLGTPETTVHALQPVSTPEEIPVELADRTNRMSAQPARRSSTGKVRVMPHGRKCSYLSNSLSCALGSRKR